MNSLQTQLLNMTIFCSSIVAVFLLGMANDANADSADAVSSRLQVHVRFSNEQTLFSGWLFRILGIQIPTWKFVEFFTDMLGNGVPLAPPPPRPPLLHAIDGCIAPYTLRGSGQVGVLERRGNYPVGHCEHLCGRKTSWSVANLCLGTCELFFLWNIESGRVMNRQIYFLLCENQTCSICHAGSNWIQHCVDSPQKTEHECANSQHVGIFSFQPSLLIICF